MVGLSRSTIWRPEKIGDFPPRRNIGKASIARVLGEIHEWMKSRPKSMKTL
jgi:predicted DNA-binding transcriptional regulator AlpA